MIALKISLSGLLFSYLIIEGRMPPADLSSVLIGFLSLFQVNTLILFLILRALNDHSTLHARRERKVLPLNPRLESHLHSPRTVTLPKSRLQSTVVVRLWEPFLLSICQGLHLTIFHAFPMAKKPPLSSVLNLGGSEVLTRKWVRGSGHRRKCSFLPPGAARAPPHSHLPGQVFGPT